jgi:elongation factor Ts
MSKIAAADINKLRKQTGAGMVDCKRALIESNGDFDAAVDVLRKKGQKIAAKRADRTAAEGVVIAATNSEKSRGVIISLNCETDFVAKNSDFISLANNILINSIDKNISNNDDLQNMRLDDDMTVEQKIVQQTGIIGEKLSVSIEIIDANSVISYIHPGNRLATIVGFNKEEKEDVMKDIAMQVAAMNPIALDKDQVSEETIQRELTIAKDQAKEEGKPEQMLDKIAFGRLNKFFKENTLLNQPFIKDGKKTVSQYLKEQDQDFLVTEFRRIQLES